MSKKPSPSMEPKALLEQLKSLLKKGNYKAISAQLAGKKQTAKLLEISGDLINDIISPNLQEDTFNNKPKLYACADDLLKRLVVQAPSDELMLEIIEFIRNRNSKHVFNTALNALQVLLLHFDDNKVHEFEYALNSIETHLEQLPKYPKIYKHAKDRMLLECFNAIESFYEPILKEVLAQKEDTVNNFLNVNLSRRNLLLFFFIRLLDKPLALLNLKKNEGQYVMEVRRKLTAAATDCLGNPFLLLNIVERRTRFRPMLKIDDYTPDCQNYFLIEDKLPLRAIAIYFYMLLVEEVSLRAVPLVYSPQFVLDTALYLCVELFKQKEPEMRNYGLKLALCLLGRLNGTEFSRDALYLEVHRDFVYNLCGIIDECSQIDECREVTVLLEQYIRKYRDEDKGLIIRNVLRITLHEGLQSSVCALYFELVERFLRPNISRLPASFSGECFRDIMLKFFFHLSKGADTDWLEEADRIFPALIFLKQFSKLDQRNLTGFWDIYEEINKNYLQPLQTALGDFNVEDYPEDYIKQMKMVTFKIVDSYTSILPSYVYPDPHWHSKMIKEQGLETPSLMAPFFQFNSFKVLLKNILKAECPMPYNLVRLACKIEITDEEAAVQQIIHDTAQGKEAEESLCIIFHL